MFNIEEKFDMFVGLNVQDVYVCSIDTIDIGVIWVIGLEMEGEVWRVNWVELEIKNISISLELIE